MACCFIVPSADYDYGDGDNYDYDYDYVNVEMESLPLCARCVLMLVV